MFQIDRVVNCLGRMHFRYATCKQGRGYKVCYGDAPISFPNSWWEWCTIAKVLIKAFSFIIFAIFLFFSLENFSWPSREFALMTSGEQIIFYIGYQLRKGSGKWVKIMPSKIRVARIINPVLLFVIFSMCYAYIDTWSPVDHFV